MRLALGATILATATACGGEKKVDPYEASLAQGSEHVELHGVVGGRAVAGSGDFTNVPDRGRLTFHAGSTTIHEVLDGHTLYVRTPGSWTRARVRGAQTPAQLFRARRPARIENGLVREITTRDAQGTLRIEFSRYGEHVSVTVPRAKGS